MKPVLAICLAGALGGCVAPKTASFRPSPQVAVQLAECLAVELRAYPEPATLRVEEPLDRAVFDVLTARGWELSPAAADGSPGLVVSAVPVAEKILVRLDSPYFTLSQLFRVDGAGLVHPASAPSLLLKPLDRHELVPETFR